MGASEREGRKEGRKEGMGLRMSKETQNGSFLL